MNTPKRIMDAALRIARSQAEEEAIILIIKLIKGDQYLTPEIQAAENAIIRAFVERTELIEALGNWLPAVEPDSRYRGDRDQELIEKDTELLRRCKQP